MNHAHQMTIEELQKCEAEFRETLERQQRAIEKIKDHLEVLAMHGCDALVIKIGADEAKATHLLLARYALNLLAHKAYRTELMQLEHTPTEEL